jgi:RNA polymerase sigma factor for flagellar operon FliA
MSKRKYIFPAAMWEAYFKMRDVDTRNALAAHYLELVKKQASMVVKALPPSVDIDDLIQAGSVGLMQAIASFDPAKAQFPTHAQIRIRGEIIDYLRQQAPVSRRVLKLVKEIDTAEGMMTQQLSRKPSEEELSNEVSRPVNSWNIHRARNHFTSSLDHVLESERHKCTVADTIPDVRHGDPAEIAAHKDFVDAVERYVIAHCPLRQALLFKMRFRFGMQCKDTCKALGVSDVTSFYWMKLVMAKIQRALAEGELAFGRMR